MAKVQATVTVTVDEGTFEVAQMSQNVQQMIGFMDEWRQKEADTVSDLLMIRGAIRDIQNSLVATIREETAAAAAAASKDVAPQADTTPQADAGEAA